MPEPLHARFSTPFLRVFLTAIIVLGAMVGTGSHPAAAACAIDETALDLLIRAIGTGQTGIIDLTGCGTITLGGRLNSNGPYDGPARPRSRRSRAM